MGIKKSNIQVGSLVTVISNTTGDAHENYIGEVGKVIQIHEGADLGWHDKAGALPYRVQIQGGPNTCTCFSAEELSLYTPEAPR